MLYTFSLSNFPELTRFYSVVRNTVWQISERENLLIIINNGRCSITCNNKTYELQKGDIFFIPKDCSYIRTPINSEMCDMTYIHFLFDDDCSECDNIDKIKNTLISLKNQAETEMLGGDRCSFGNIICIGNKNHLKDKKRTQLRDTLKELSKHSGINKSFLNSLSLCKILTLLSNEVIYKILTDSNTDNVITIPKKLRRCIDYISRNYTSNITLDELAEYSNVSKQQLIRYFKATLNTTPTQYITDFKITRAKEMLFYHSELTINEIALELGFDNQHYFSKVFKKITGETPSDYRYRTVNYHILHKDIQI